MKKPSPRTLKILTLLNRISAAQVEEKQKELGLVNRRIELIDARKKGIKRSLAQTSEYAAGSDDPLMHHMAGSYQAKAEEELKHLGDDKKAAEEDWAEKQAQLAETYADHKRHDILLTKGKDAYKKAAEKRTMHRLDEQAGARYKKSL